MAGPPAVPLGPLPPGPVVSATQEGPVSALGCDTHVSNGHPTVPPYIYIYTYIYIYIYMI